MGNGWLLGLMIIVASVLMPTEHATAAMGMPDYTYEVSADGQYKVMIMSPEDVMTQLMFGAAGKVIGICVHKRDDNKPGKKIACFEHGKNPQFFDGYHRGGDDDPYLSGEIGPEAYPGEEDVGLGIGLE